MARRKSSTADVGLGTFVTSYRHHHTGKIMRASDYGLKAFYFPPRKNNGDSESTDDSVSLVTKEETKPDSSNEKKEE